MEAKRALSFGEPGAAEVELLVYEDYSKGTCGYTWLCAEITCDYLFRNREKFSNKNVVDLGCGTGLVGLMLRKLGCTITFIDINTLISKRNYELNFGSMEGATFLELDWNDPYSIIYVEKLLGIDMVVGSDIFYETEGDLESSDHEDIFMLLHVIAKNNYNVKIYVPYQVRSVKFNLCYLIKFWNFHPSICPEYTEDSRLFLERKVDINACFELIILDLRH